jgi:hypothetical protein
LIEAVLIAGTGSSQLRLRWLDPTHPAEPTPASPAEVALTLIGPGEGRALVVADSDSAALYHATLEITAGATYRLEGTIGSVPIAATTIIPRGFELAAPAADTIRLEAAVDDIAISTVPFQWDIPGATAVQADSVRFFPGYQWTRQTSGVFSLLRRPPGSPPGPRIRFRAINLAADRYLISGETNIHGGFGVLGGAVERVKVVAWR